MVPMRSLRFTLCLAAALFCVHGFAAGVRAEQQDNQQYLHWAKFKPGSSVAMSGQMDANGQKLQIDMINVLVEVNKDKVVLESTSAVNIAGVDRKSPGRKRDVPAREEKKADVKQLGEEEIEAAGKKFKCKVMEGEADAPNAQGGKAKAKIWVTEEVPGGAVKMVVTSERGTMTFTLKSFEVK
jgi:hypothetical protein